MGLRDQRNADICQRLNALSRAGLSKKEAAKALDISYGTVARLSIKWNIDFARKYTAIVNAGAEERADEFAVRYRNGETLRQIGESHGLTRERVRQILAKKKGMGGTDGGAFVRGAKRKGDIRTRRSIDCRAKWGCEVEEYDQLLAIGREMVAAGSARETTPTGAFRSQKQNAKSRGIEWRLSLWQWWTIWQESGRWEQRGRGHGYMMCRKGDTGPYAPGNVVIAPGHFNSSSGPHKKSGLPTGVSIKRGRFVAIICVGGIKKYLGVFATAEQAHSTYLTALAEATKEQAA